jgi:hypothetical protein
MFGNGSAVYSEALHVKIGLFESGTLYFDMELFKTSLGLHFLANPKLWLLIKLLRMYRAKDTKPWVILAITSCHASWNSHLVTQKQKASELNLVPKQPAPKPKPSKVDCMLIVFR